VKGWRALLDQGVSERTRLDKIQSANRKSHALNLANGPKKESTEVKYRKSQDREFYKLFFPGPGKNPFAGIQGAR